MNRTYLGQCVFHQPCRRDNGFEARLFADRAEETDVPVPVRDTVLFPERLGGTQLGGQ
jgi:hypothetical protein